MGLTFIREKAVRPGMLKGSLNVGHIRKYPPWYLKNRCRFLCQSSGQKEEHFTILSQKK